MKRLFLTLFLVSLFWIGCASHTTLVVTSVPEGAKIITNSGKSFVSPAKISFEWDDRYTENGCLRVEGVRAIWQSGAIASSSPAILLCANGGEHNFVIRRPSGVPGLEIDNNYAYQLIQKREHDQVRLNQEKAYFFRELGYTLGTMMPR